MRYFSNAQWYRIMLMYHFFHVLQERQGYLTFPNSSVIPSLVAWKTDKWFVCIRACSSSNRCSNCTEPLFITLNLKLAHRSNATTSPCSAAETFLTQLNTDEFEANVNLYVISIDQPAGFWTVYWLSMSIGIFFSLIHFATSLSITHVLSAINNIKNLKGYFHELFQQPLSDIDDLGGDPLMPNIKLNVSRTPETTEVEHILGLLSVLEIFGVVHTIIYLRVGDMGLPKWPGHAIAAWGSASLSGLFLLAGFSMFLRVHLALEGKDSAGKSSRVSGLTAAGKSLSSTTL